MKKHITSGLAASAAIVWASTAFAAEQHTVLILPDAFFPEITYAKPGDSIKFVNMQAGDTTIVGNEAAWELGPVSSDNYKVLALNSDTTGAFFDAEDKDEDGNYALRGEITFDDPPVE